MNDTNLLNTPIAESTAKENTEIELAELRTVLFDNPEAINVKIDLIKEEIESGRYHIHYPNIAKQLLGMCKTNQETEETYDTTLEDTTA